uniref:Pentatricopeptide repeat protein n=1 Tax=Salvia miltiorrhiza TaxID=226208 RepID=A0A678WCJ9_SALMI|nr:pentatricopeptide repeat protein [Salvia miltiorrhiza]
MEINAALFQSLKSLIQLKNVHARLFRFHLHRDQFILNMVLKSAFHFNRPDYATALFNETQPNFHLYHTMIRGFVSKDHFDDAINFFHVMRREGFWANNFIFTFVLKSCLKNMDTKLGMSVHSLIVKEGFEYDSYVNTGLVGLYSKLERLSDARKLFDEMPEKNVVSWAAVMSGYVSVGRFKEAVDLFRDSLEAGLKPDSYTLVRALSACSQLGDLVVGEWIHKYAVDIGMARNVFVNTALVDMYAKCGDMEKARTIFDGMHERDIVTWGIMVQGYAAYGFPKEALELFHMMLRENLGPDHYVIVGVLSACARLGASELGERACSMMDRNEFLCNPVLGTALIDMYAKCGKIALAWEVFQGMKTKDLVVFNAVISGLAMTGHTKTAFSCFGVVQKCGWKGDGNTFLGLLCGCAHAGFVEDGRRFFNGMSGLYSLDPIPTIEHYGSMVDLLARAGLLNEAHDMILSMPMDANSIVWGALLAGCRLHKNTRLAEHVLERLIELEPWNSGNYVLLSNIYSANQKWDESESIRAVMHEQGIQKMRGCSWIEVDGIVHEFLVGDTSHAMSGEIYGKLSELGRELREAGFVAATEYVLFDIEEEEKEHFLGCHSEKLALAFGLIATKANSVIRIVKNLRVCGDCHAAIKLVSRITGREVIVRDTNRFHHFVDGSCSCGDYW